MLTLTFIFKVQENIRTEIRIVVSDTQNISFPHIICRCKLDLSCYLILHNLEFDCKVIINVIKMTEEGSVNP